MFYRKSKSPFVIKVSWSSLFSSYDPVKYTAPEVLNAASDEVDPEITNDTRIKFNKVFCVLYTSCIDPADIFWGTGDVRNLVRTCMKILH